MAQAERKAETDEPQQNATEKLADYLKAAMTPELAVALQDPKRFEVAEFELRQVVAKLTKWFV